MPRQGQGPQLDQQHDMKQLCELGVPPEAFQGLFLDALQDAELVLLVL